VYAMSENGKLVVSLGKLVGFQVGLLPNRSADTRLLYCTTGVLLQKLIKTKNLGFYTHIILDKVHVRDNEMDFLFIVIKILLSTFAGNVKIILMSATIDVEEVCVKF
jgi:ATP-dependent RNA helicase TDRD9